MKMVKYLCIDLRTCALIIAAIELLSSILLFFTVGILFALGKIAVTGCLIYGILVRKPTFLIPFLFVNCISIIGAIIGLVLIVLKSTDKGSDDDGDANSFTTPMTDQNDGMQMHKTMYIALAIGILALSAHSWLVTYALYKYDTRFENKIDDALNVTVSNYPPLQNVATIDDEYRFTYK